MIPKWLAYALGGLLLYGLWRGDGWSVSDIWSPSSSPQEAAQADRDIVTAAGAVVVAE
jgi:hypothetical protein